MEQRHKHQEGQDCGAQEEDDLLHQEPCRGQKGQGDRWEVPWEPACPCILGSFCGYLHPMSLPGPWILL